MQKNKRLHDEIENLSEEILESAKNQAEKIINEAKEKSKLILKNSKNEILKEIQELYKKNKERIQKLGENRIINVQMSTYRELIREKEKIIQNIFNILENKLQEVIKTERYKSFLISSLIKVIDYINEPKIQLILTDNDTSLININEIISKLNNKNVQITISNDKLSSEDIGGFIIVVPDKNYQITHTLKEIIDKKRDILRNIINKYLEGA